VKIKKNRKVKFKSILRILSFFLIIGLFIEAYIYFPRLIVIREIVCKSQFGPCNEIVNYNLNQFTETKMKDTNKLINDYLSKNVLVGDYKSEYMFPDKLVVNVIENKPNYALKVGKQKYLLVDSEGYIITSQESTNLPFVDGNTEKTIAEKIEDSNFFALELVYLMYDSIEFSEARIIESRLEIALDSGILVLFPLNGDKKLLAGSLSLILSRLNQEEGETRIEDVQEVKIIDLRFNNPVIK